MKIKKNGVTINLTESDIKKLSKRILKEQDQQEVEFINSKDYGRVKETLSEKVKYGNGDISVVHTPQSRRWELTFNDKPGSTVTFIIPTNDLCEVLPIV